MPPPDDIATHNAPEGNHPANLTAIARALAARLGMDPEMLADLTTRNHQRFFTPELR
jgi:Tat protein secretion system quality control protein TatD with DNase activity